jgi:putative DNA primase/helicase
MSLDPEVLALARKAVEALSPRLQAEPKSTNGADRARPVRSSEPTDPFPPADAWPDPLEGDKLLDEIRDLLLMHVVLPLHAVTALVLWIAHTYLLDFADFTPYIWITSPVRACGKSTLLELLRCLVFRPQLSGGITAAALVRRIDRLAPTMLLDELDAKLKVHHEAGENLRGVLNTGFERHGTHTVCV